MVKMTETQPRPPAIETAHQSAHQSAWAVAAESLLTAAWYAMPDYILSRRRRAVAKTVVLVGAGLCGIHLGRSVNDEESASAAEPSKDVNDPLDAVKPSSDASATQISEQEAVKKGLIIVIVGAALGAGAIYFETLIHRAANGLRERGLRRPHTVIGIIMGALTPLAQRGIQQAITSRAGV